MRAKQILEKEGIELPEWAKVKNKSTLIVTAGADWEGYKDYEVSIADVVFYYYRDARNIMSGCRSLGKITGDWRNIDFLASECLYIFKMINRQGVEKEARKYGMTLRSKDE